MRINLLFLIAIIISAKAISEQNQPEDKVQKDVLDDLDLSLSFPSFKPTMPTFKPTMPTFKPINTIRPTNLFKPTTLNPTNTFKPINTIKPISTLKPTTSTVKPIINPRNNFQNAKNKINGFYNGLNNLPNSLPVVNPLNNRKDFNIGKRGKIGMENDFHNAKIDGSYTRTKNLGPGMKRDTKYSGSIGAKFEDGKKGISGSIGKTTTNYRGPFYTQKGNQHSLSVDAIHKNGNRGIEGTYTNTRSNGRGIRIGKNDISNIHSRERKYTLGGGVESNGRRYGNVGYQNKITNTQSFGNGNNKVSRSDYTARDHQIRGGYRKTGNGREIDGSYTRKNINGQTITRGRTSLTRENEVGNIYNGKVNIGRHGGSVEGGLERYNQQTIKGKVGAIETSYSRRNYRNIQGGANGSYRNGIFKGGLGGSYANGQTHTGKIGDAQVTVGRENKYSGNIGVTSSRYGVGINAQGQRSRTYNGGINAGNVNIGGSFGQTQTIGGGAYMNRNGLGVRGNYGQRFDIKGSGRIGNHQVDANGHFSKNTYGGIGVRGNRNGGSVNANVGREYSAGGLVNVNGRKVGADGRVNGQINGNIGIDRRTGFNAQVGGRGQAHFGGQIGRRGAQVNLSSDIRINGGFNKRGIPHLNVHGGLHGGIDIKTGNGRTMHLGGQTLRNGFNSVKRGVNSLRNKITRNVGPRTFGRIIKSKRR